MSTLYHFLEFAAAGAFYGVWAGLLAWAIWRTLQLREDRRRRANAAYREALSQAFADIEDAFVDLANAMERHQPKSIDVEVLDVGGEPASRARTGGGLMRLHLGAPREPLFAVIETRPAIINGHVYPQVGRPKRQITWMYGVSWGTGAGFVFIGVQFHKKQRGEG